MAWLFLIKSSAVATPDQNKTPSILKSRLSGNVDKLHKQCPTLHMIRPNHHVTAPEGACRQYWYGGLHRQVSDSYRTLFSNRVQTVFQPWLSRSVRRCIRCDRLSTNHRREESLYLQWEAMTGGKKRCAGASDAYQRGQ